MWISYYFEGAEDLVIRRGEALKLDLELQVFAEQAPVDPFEEFAAVLSIG
jgi:hypothetical protein